MGCDMDFSSDNTVFRGYAFWALTLFWRNQVSLLEFPGELEQALLSDGIRLNSYRVMSNTVSQIAVQAHLKLAPKDVVRLIKGRIQYAIRKTDPKAFQRNFAIRSYGGQIRLAVEGYISKQLQHHGLYQNDAFDFLDGIQIRNSSVDLRKPTYSNHAVYWYNLHLVIANTIRTMDVDRGALNEISEAITRLSSEIEWPVSRAGILPEHLHLAFRPNYEVSPENAALFWLNNLEGIHAKLGSFRHAASITTFGEYDSRVIPRKRLLLRGIR